MQIKPRVRIVGAERAQLAQLVAGRHQAGESIRNLALSIGRSYGFIHALLKEAGVELRHRGGDHRPRRPRAGAEQVDARTDRPPHCCAGALHKHVFLPHGRRPEPDAQAAAALRWRL